MRTIVLSVILFCCGMSHVTAQSDYIVTTPSAQEIPASEEEQFIIKHIPLKPLCKWTPGMKFMFAPSAREMFLPTLLIYNTEKGVDNSLMRHKILTFTGTEEKVQKIADQTNYTTRFVFEDEGEKYYYDIKNMRLDEICERMPRACINGLVYLQDVDTAKEAGMDGIFVNWGFRGREFLLEHGAKCVVDTPEELERLLIGKA